MKIEPGPCCDYQDCPRHKQIIDRDLRRGYYCSTDCKDDEKKRQRRKAHSNG